MSATAKPSASPLDRELVLTRFTDKHARTRKQFTTTLRGLVPLIEKRTAPSKSALPWLKLAAFGDVPTPKGTLRHDRNVLTVSGVEADYDGEAMGLEEAAELLADAGIAAMLYTSPSHTPEKPRWRVLAPCSDDLAPERRAALVARLNGVLGGTLAAESFALSQAYYYGTVEGGTPLRAELVEGEFLDRLDGLDAGAIGKRKAAADWTDEVMADRQRSNRDESRSGRGFAVARKARREGRDFDAFLVELKADPELAAWAADPRQVQRAWDNATPEPWQSQLMRNDNGKALSNEANGFAMLRAHPELAGCLGFDLMERIAMVLRRLPGDAVGDPVPRRVSDGDAVTVAAFLQRAGLAAIRPGTVAGVMEAVARENAFHPVRDYLDALRWDGTLRLSTWLRRYAGAEDSPYVEMVARCFLIAMVARAFKPGCKADYMPVLEGLQGGGKSTLCAILGDRWFTDGLPDLQRDPVRVSMHLRGNWLVEVAEMSAMSKAETAELKAFLTRTSEKFVPKYGRAEVEEPRQCFFVGTVNPDGNGYLKDTTGGRRYWPVTVGHQLNTDGLRADRDQLFAEAVAAFRAGEPWWPTRGFEAEHAAPVQDARAVADAWQDIVADWLTMGGGRGRDELTTHEIAIQALGITSQHLSAATQGRIGNAMRAIGWTARRSEKRRWWEIEI